MKQALPLALILAWTLAVRAQQAPAPAAPAAKPLIPTTASSIVETPDAFIGQTVSLMAPVESRVSATAFSVDQDRTRSTGKEILVLAPRLNGALEPNAYVTVIGELVRFEPEEIAQRVKDIPLDLPADVVAKYRGKPALIATAVINGAMLDLARRVAAPMTADEEAHSTIMKRVGPASNALRQAVGASNADVVKEQSAILTQAFVETGAFWKAHGKADAAAWAEDARRQVEVVERAAAGAKWDDARAAAGTLNQACQSCHNTYRERFDDGAYRIKK